MTVGLGYLAATAIFAVLLIGFIAAQVTARRFHPLLYWATIIASTTAGTTMPNYATRSLGIGYAGASVLLLALVLNSLFAWRITLGRIDADAITDWRAELFYWLTITFSQTLGTALGDWLADTGSPDYFGAAAIFGIALSAVTLLYYRTTVCRVLLFWAAFILTRPLGAAVGDFLDKPIDKGDLGFSRPLATAVLAAAILTLILALPQRASRHGHAPA